MPVAGIFFQWGPRRLGRIVVAQNFFGGDATSNRSSSGTSGDSGSGEVTRGGFGGFARAFAAHFSGGG